MVFTSAAVIESGWPEMAVGPLSAPGKNRVEWGRPPGFGLGFYESGHPACCALVPPLPRSSCGNAGPRRRPPGGAYALLQRLRLQMHRDLILYRYAAFSGYGDVTAFDPGPSDRWFPLTYPVLARWGGSADPSRRSYAFDTPLPDYVDPGDPGDRYFLEAKALRDGYARQAIYAGNELLARFPQSRYAGDVLMSLDGLTGEAAFLGRLLAQFPDSDRALEAALGLGPVDH